MTCPCDQRAWPPTLSIQPGLDDLPRQLVAFWDLREEMLARASQEPALAAWSGRARDDYGVMLLELWAYVGELLSVYDKAIADESYVRTAKLRPSLRRLVASLGYVPRPAVASTAELALLADGVRPVTIAAGTAFRSGAFGSEKPQVFELTAPAAIHPALNQWPIATPVGKTISGSLTQLDLDPTTVKLASGDAVLIALSDKASQTYVRTVKSVDRVVDDAGRRVARLTLDASIDAGAGVPVSAITIQRATQKAGLKTPYISPDPSSVDDNGKFILDGVHPRVHANERILVEVAGYQTWATVSSRAEHFHRVVADGKGHDTTVNMKDKDGKDSGSATVQGRDPDPVTAAFTTIHTDYKPPRKFVELQLPSYGWSSTWMSLWWVSLLWLPDPTDYTIHFHLVDAGRVLGPLQKTISPGDPLVAMKTRAPVNSTASTEKIILRDTEKYAVEIGGTIQLGPGVITPDGGTTWTPPLATPVTGFGNVVTATRGETVAMEVLGSGDASQKSQSFELAKKPLTYVAAPGTDSGVASTLQVWVDGLLWTEVPTFYGQPHTAQVYEVRQDDDDASHVIFGDGLRGARLTTGAGNVIASYRFGAGAAAPPAGSIAQISKPVPGLKGMVGPLAAVGGADAEPASSLATLAPRSALLLGRAISIDDMEVAALGAPGMTTARAEWAWDGVAQRPVVKVWIVGGDNVQQAFLGQVGERLRALADPSTPIRVAYATEKKARLWIDLELDPRRIAADVIAAAQTALVGDGGWLTPAQLGIDRSLFRSVLIERLCTITGVTGVRSLIWNWLPLFAYGVTPGQGAIFDLVSWLKVTGELTMADDTTPVTADDHYERFFAEKLWELLPGVYKHEDGLAERPGTLRAFIELIAEQAALLRRSHDKLWDDAFIDLCDDWAVPYIGDLVATRMVSALNTRGRRVDVAKTIYYRRRKGTPRVLEELIADITGWDGKVVESFRFLARCAHRLNPPIAERVDPSPGWADLRLPRIAETADGPWDPFAHTADVRKAHGRNGRWNIPEISFHLFRLASISLRGVQPHARADGATFTFDPSGREVQLFMPRLRDEQYSWEAWRSARPWEVPAPMACRTLGDAEYTITDELVAKLIAAGVSNAAAAELAPVVGERFPTEATLLTWLESIPDVPQRNELLAESNYDRLRAGALIADCGKSALWPEGVSVAPTGGLPVATERTAGANLTDWSLTDPHRDLLVDPVRGRFAFTAHTAPADPATARVDYSYGLGGGIGAGGTDRRATLDEAPAVTVPTPPATGALVVDAAALPTDADGNLTGTVELPDSATYSIKGNPAKVAALVIQAANFERPYVELAADWIFTAAAGKPATLAIDGLWLGVPATVTTSPAPALVLRGAWTTVELRHVTLDPGGTDVDKATLPPVAIWVEGSVDRLVIDHSIAATIGVRNGGELDELVVSDSILDAQAPASGGIAVTLTPGDVEMRRTTVIGGLEVGHLDASDTLCTGLVEVTDTQGGCFRFSAAPGGSRLPHPYRWVEWDGGAAFASVRFGDAGYAWLADNAPAALERGGDGGVEIGAWSSALAAIKEDGLLTKVEEYLPFGLVPMFIHET